MPGHDRGHPFAVGQRRTGYIQPQIGLPRLFVEAVTLEAVLGEDRAHVAVEVERLLRFRTNSAKRKSQQIKENLGMHGRRAHREMMRCGRDYYHIPRRGAAATGFTEYVPILAAEHLRRREARGKPRG